MGSVAEGQWGAVEPPNLSMEGGVSTDPCQELAMGRRSPGGEGYGEKGLGLAREAREPGGRGLVG